MLESGYGLKSGVSLFIAANVCEQVFWKLFSPITFRTENGVEFEGIIIALFHYIIIKSNFKEIFTYILFRNKLVNMKDVIMTIVIFLIMVYF